MASAPTAARLLVLSGFVAAHSALPAAQTYLRLQKLRIATLLLRALATSCGALHLALCFTLSCVSCLPYANDSNCLSWHNLHSPHLAVTGAAVAPIREPGFRVACHSLSATLYVSRAAGGFLLCRIPFFFLNSFPSTSSIRFFPFPVPHLDLPVAARLQRTGHCYVFFGALLPSAWERRQRCLISSACSSLPHVGRAPSRSHLPCNGLQAPN